jgi:3-methyladenine DNA glycosylase AlkD
MTAALLDEVRGQLAAQRVTSPQAQKIAAAVYRQIKGWPLAERNCFCNELWKSGSGEEGTVAIYLYRHFRSQCSLCEFRLFEKWIDRYVNNWGHCDGVAHYLISASIENEPELAALLGPWTASANRWKRRAAAVSLVHGARRGKNLRMIFQIAERLLPDDDDLVRKAVGWLLKEAYSAKPREVVRFLKARKKSAPRLVLRIAAEKMGTTDRDAVLG